MVTDDEIFSSLCEICRFNCRNEEIMKDNEKELSHDHQRERHSQVKVVGPVPRGGPLLVLTTEPQAHVSP